MLLKLSALSTKGKSWSFGVAAGFSLHPLKNLSIYGDGGVVVTNQPYIYKKIKKLRNHGLKNRDSCALWGYNSRLDTLPGSIRWESSLKNYRRSIKGTN